jgi:outer membrane receptor for ferrienterochelin and colicin
VKTVKKLKTILIFLLTVVFYTNQVNAQPGKIESSTLAGKTEKGVLRGTVLEKSSGEPLAGVTVYLEGTSLAAISDSAGCYKLQNIPAGKHKLLSSLMSYSTVSVPDLVIAAGINELNIVMEESANMLDEVVVSSVKRMHSEIAFINATRSADVVMSGISGRQIARTQDRNAAEVVRRIPGVSLTDDRYIMVRGLAGRYNNVWINNSAVPSTESDTRAFSFDMLPGSQLESIMIVKSPSADIPADFSGGFVKIMTKGMPGKNEILFSWGMNLNTSTHFRDFIYNTPSATDFLGFDNGSRSAGTIIPRRMNNSDYAQVTDITRNGFRNDWSLSLKKVLPDHKVNFMISRYKKFLSGGELGVVGALNYSLSSLSINDMQNSRYGVYNSVEDEPEYLYSYMDDQYSIDAKTGVMLNVSYMKGDSRIEFRNTLNQQGKNRYTTREGWQNLSARYNQQKDEYLYSARTTYTGQLAGSHRLGWSDIDWNAGYSYAGLNQPDRRIINREENLIYGDRYYGLMAIDQNEITRDFVELDEHTVSGALNLTYPCSLSDNVKGELKTGLYVEYKNRDYRNRQFFYRFNQYNLPEDFVYGDVVNEILTTENFSSDKLYIYEDTDNRNSYGGINTLGAAYLSYKISAGKFNLLAGLRVEANLMKIKSYDKIYEFSTTLRHYDHVNVFPSLNASYNIDKKNLLRIAYGTSVNRHEFREVSPSVYYDFNLFSDVKGNPDLKNATIHNLDLRYELYPATDEYVTLALFYKRFINPIEWTYLDAGGSYTYTFENALAANNFGAEADIRKNLGFLGLKGFTLGLNAALIYSRINFDHDNSLEVDRPMQGQSPYLVNLSLFYDLPSCGLNAGILYNRIGKRIVGIGRVDTGSGASINNDVPDTYELPRDLLDFVLTKRIGKHTELKLNAKDILNQDVVFIQYPKFVDNEGVVQTRNQTVKKFKPGINMFLGLQFNF